MIIGGASNAIGDESLNDAVVALGDILLELQSKLDNGGEVRLNAADITALQTVTATVLGLPLNYPDSGANDKLTAVLAALQGTLNVAVNNFPTDVSDSGTHVYLSQALDRLTGILGETGDTNTLLEEVRDAITALPTPVTGLTDAQLRAAPVPVTGTVAVSNPGLTDTQLRATPVAVTDTRNDYPSSGANTRLDTLHTDNGTATTSPPSAGTGIIGWLRGIYDKVAALPTAIGLTDAQLRASAVPVTDTRTDYPSTSANTKLDTLHADLAAGITTDAGKQTQYVISGTTTLAGDTVTTADVSAYHYVTVATTTTGTALNSANNIFEGSFNGTTWFPVVLGSLSASPQTANGTAPWLSYVLNGITTTFMGGPCPFTFFRFRQISTFTGGVSVTITANNAPTLAGYHVNNVDGRTASHSSPDVEANLRVFNGTSTDRVRSGVRAHLAATTFTGSVQVVTNSGALVLSAATATTTGATQNLGQTVSVHGLQVRLNSGTVTAAQVKLLGSIDGSAFFTILSWDTASGQALGDIVFITGKPVNYVRVDVSTLTGTSPNIIVSYNGSV